MRSWLAFVLCLALLPAIAAAEPQAARDDYQELIKLALQDFSLGHFAEAYGLFKRAHELQPSARTLRGMGLAAFEDARYLEAREHMRASMTDSRQPLTEAQRKEMQRLIARAEAYLGVYTLELDPGAAQLRIDGESERAVSSGARIELDPGHHQLTFSAVGHEPSTLSVNVAAGHQGALSVQLHPQAPSAPAPVAVKVDLASHERRPEPQSGRSVGPYVLVGVGGVTLATAVVTGIMTRSAKSDLDADCGADGACPAELESTRSRGENTKLATNVLLPVGGAALAAGVVWWILSGTKQPKSKAARSLQFACVAGGCSIGLRGEL